MIDDDETPAEMEARFRKNMPIFFGFGSMGAAGLGDTHSTGSFLLHRLSSNHELIMYVDLCQEVRWLVRMLINLYLDFSFFDESKLAIRFGP